VPDRTIQRVCAKDKSVLRILIELKKWEGIQGKGSKKVMSYCVTSPDARTALENQILPKLLVLHSHFARTIYKGTLQAQTRLGVKVLSRLYGL
jgi:hypothetical protein